METAKGAVAKGGTIEGLRKAQADGLIRHGVGFTFHGEPDTFRAAIDTGAFLMATVSYNLLKRKEEEQIAYAAEHGVGVVVMNPLAGGVLPVAGNPALSFLRGPASGTSYGALRFLLANRHITTAILGFMEVGQVDEAVKALEGAERLDEAYRQDLIKKMEGVELVKGSFCTGCGYCKDCPNGFEPTHFMKAMRDFAIYRVAEEDLPAYLRSKYPGRDPAVALEKCIECGKCEEKCPQNLKIVEQVRRAKAALSQES